MDNRIEDIVRVMNDLDQFADDFPEPRLDQEAIEKGLIVSKNACAQKEYVFATPLMKNLLVVMGDVRQEQDPKTGIWKTEKLPAGKESKAVSWMNDVVHAALLKFNGPEVKEYDHSLPVDDRKLYDTDCWLGWKPEIWDIKLGQAKEREATFKKYANSKTNFSKQEMIKLLRSSQPMQKVVLHFLKYWPETKASSDVHEISSPFMSKKTGVSYPYFANDSTRVPGTNKTYGKLCIDRVAKVVHRNSAKELIQLAADNNVYAAYPRNQRGKGRALEAQSRIVNLIVNMVNANEINELKESDYGAGFVNEEGLKKRLIKIADFVMANPQYIAINKDFTAWDTTVGYGWILLQNALRYLNANGDTTKLIIKIRNACVKKSILVNGPSGKLQPLYGRTPSGYDDTTLQNTAINYLQTDLINYRIDPDYSKNVVYPLRNQFRMCLGDDYNGVVLRGHEKDFVDFSKENGFTAHDDFKDAFGVMFIQYRLTKPTKDSDWVMLYNWPRVLRSMLSKEDQKSLGSAGWTLSFYQQLGKLIEWPEMAQIALNIAASLDKDHLSLNVPVSVLIQRSRQEDEERIGKNTSNRQQKLKRTRTLAEKLGDNPTLPGVIEANGQLTLDQNYFQHVQDVLRPLYDAQFLPKLGFAIPDLSKVH